MESVQNNSVSNVSFQGKALKSQQHVQNQTSSATPIKEGNKKLKNTLVGLGVVAAAGIGIGVLYKTGRLDKLLKKGGQQAGETATKTANETVTKANKAAQEVTIETATKVSETAQETSKQIVEKATNKTGSQAASETLSSLQAKQKELWAEAMQYNGEAMPESLSKEMNEISEKIKALQKGAVSVNQNAAQTVSKVSEEISDKALYEARQELTDKFYNGLISGDEYTKELNRLNSLDVSKAAPEVVEKTVEKAVKQIDEKALYEARQELTDKFYNGLISGDEFTKEMNKLNSLNTTKAVDAAAQKANQEAMQELTDKFYNNLISSDEFMQQMNKLNS